MDAIYWVTISLNCRFGMGENEGKLAAESANMVKVL